eukprot:751998-Hanusia_phi.AAC.2
MSAKADNKKLRCSPSSLTSGSPGLSLAQGRFRGLLSPVSVGEGGGQKRRIEGKVIESQRLVAASAGSEGVAAEIDLVKDLNDHWQHPLVPNVQDHWRSVRRGRRGGSEFSPVIPTPITSVLSTTITSDIKTSSQDNLSVCESFSMSCSRTEMSLPASTCHRGLVQPDPPLTFRLELRGPDLDAPFISSLVHLREQPHLELLTGQRRPSVPTRTLTITTAAITAAKDDRTISR